LALGIGANTAMFSLLDQIVLRLLPVQHRVPGEVRVGNYGNSYGLNRVSWPMFEDLRERNEVSPTCSAFSGHGHRRVRRSRSAGYGELVSGSYFPVLGIGAALAHIAPMTTMFLTASAVVVTAIALAELLQQTAESRERIARSGTNMTIIGVTPDSMGSSWKCRRGSSQHDKTENDPSRPQRIGGDGPPGLPLGGRLKPGISAQQAQAR